jgi:hypothetical protein
MIYPDNAIFSVKVIWLTAASNNTWNAGAMARNNGVKVPVRWWQRADATAGAFSWRNSEAATVGGDRKRCVTSGAAGVGVGRQAADETRRRRSWRRSWLQSEVLIGLCNEAARKFRRLLVTSRGLPYLKAHAGNRILFGYMGKETFLWLCSEGM